MIEYKIFSEYGQVIAPEQDPIEKALSNAPLISNNQQVNGLLDIFNNALQNLSRQSAFDLQTKPTAYYFIFKDYEMKQEGMENVLGFAKEICYNNGQSVYRIVSRSCKRPIVLTIFAHEFGHCLPPHLDYNKTPELEELKAYIFQEIMFRQMARLPNYDRNEMLAAERSLRELQRMMDDGPHKNAIKMMWKGFGRLHYKYSDLIKENIWVQLYNVVTCGKLANTFKKEDIENSPTLTIEDLMK